MWIVLGKRSPLVLLILIALSFIPVFPGVATYEAVGPARGQKITQRVGSQKFILKDGRLYLLRNETRHALVLVTYFRKVTWGEKELDELRKHHAELDVEALWQQEAPPNK
jgi:hypothetical protein